MKVSADGLELIKAFEGCHRHIGGGRFKAYLDPVNVLTIGYGHTNHHPPKIYPDTVWSQAQCDEQLRRDLAIFEAAVDRLVTVPLKQHQFDALVSFAFNLGEVNLSRSSLLRKLNAGDYNGAAGEFKNWVKAGGKVLAGLVRRRRSEMLMFQGIFDRNYDGQPDGPTARRIDPPAPPRDASVPDVVGATGAATAVTVGVAQGWSPGIIMAVVVVAVIALVAFKIWKNRRD